MTISTSVSKGLEINQQPRTMSPTKTIGPKLQRTLHQLAIDVVAVELRISRISTVFRQILPLLYKALRRPRNHQSRIHTTDTHLRMRILRPVLVTHLPVPAPQNLDALLPNGNVLSRTAAVPFRNSRQTTTFLRTTTVSCHRMSGNVRNHLVFFPNRNQGISPINVESRM